jgi:serine kinase of HPr protein (carbohydrate metabolism regulator)
VHPPTQTYALIHAATAQTQIHASCVLLDGGAVLLRGASGAGKSDLALRLIDRGGKLVADDRVDIYRRGGVLVARAPIPLQGLIEVRGIGIVRLPSVIDAPISLVVDLVPRDRVERLPEDSTVTILGIRLGHRALDPFDISTPLKIVLAAKSGAGVTSSAPAA